MQSHNDGPDHESIARLKRLVDDQTTESLEEKAKRMLEAGESQITAGREGESVLRQWIHGRAHVQKLPDDEHGLCRISVGGSSDMIYVVYRGDIGKCRDQLRAALAAFQAAPKPAVR